MTTSPDLHRDDGAAPATPPVRRHRRRSRLRTTVWITAVAMAAMLGSERIYWFWAGIDVDSISVLTVFYSVAAAGAVCVMALVPVVSTRQLVLAGAVYALVVEGVITPVMYEDGPLPLLFLMFVGWHGVFAFAGLFVVVRRWLLDGRLVHLAAAGTATGLGWALWAVATLAGDTETPRTLLADGEPVHVLGPAAFAVYAAWVGVLLAAAHVVLGWCWPAPGWRPSRGAQATVAVLTAALALLLVVPAVPWAPVKFGVFAWILHRFLRRARPDGDPGDVTPLLDRLGGHVPLRRLVALAPLPATAAGAYALLWPLRDESWMGGLYGALVLGQVAVGTGLLVWAVSPGGAADGRRPRARRRVPRPR